MQYFRRAQRYKIPDGLTKRNTRLIHRKTIHTIQQHHNACAHSFFIRRKTGIMQGRHRILYRRTHPQHPHHTGYRLQINSEIFSQSQRFHQTDMFLSQKLSGSPDKLFCQQPVIHQHRQTVHRFIPFKPTSVKSADRFRLLIYQLKNPVP